jgi:hypothetical protein
MRVTDMLKRMGCQCKGDRCDGECQRILRTFIAFPQLKNCCSQPVQAIVGAARSAHFSEVVSHWLVVRAYCTHIQPVVVQSRSFVRLGVLQLVHDESQSI